MARSHGVIKAEVWEVGSDYRRLSVDPQWAFEMLISQPQINNLGLLPYVPEKWCRLAADLTRPRLDHALQTLDELRYTITDIDTSELLVRTFIRHDGVWKQPKLVTNARRLLRETESDTIRAYLAQQHPWLLDTRWTSARIEKHETRPRTPETPSDSPPDTPSTEPVETVEGEPLTEGVTEPLPEGLSEPLTEGVSPPRAPTRDGLPLPQDQDQPQALQQLATEGCTPRANADRHTEPGTALDLHDIRTTITQSLADAASHD